MKKKYVWIALVILLLVLCLYALSKKLEVNIHEINSTKILSKIRIAVLSDVHSSDYGLELRELQDEVIKLDPDFIVLPGDIIHDVKVPAEDTFKFIDNISKLYPTFYVTGNHEFWSNFGIEIKETISKTNAKVLDGNCEMIQIEDDKVNVCGLDDIDGFEYEGIDISNQVDTISNLVNTSNYNILLNHKPNAIENLDGLGFDLMISGHAHGGQIRIPFTNISAIAPDQGIFPKYTSGIYNDYETLLAVSRGLDKHSTDPIPRIFNRPEIMVIDIINQ